MHVAAESSGQTSSGFQSQERQVARGSSDPADDNTERVSRKLCVRLKLLAKDTVQY